MAIRVEHGGGGIEAGIAKGLNEFLSTQLEQKRQDELFNKEIEAKKELEDYHAKTQVEIYKQKMNFDILAQQMSNEQQISHMMALDEAKFQRNLKRVEEARSEFDLNVKSIMDSDIVKDNPARIEELIFDQKMKLASTLSFAGIPQTSIMAELNLKQPENLTLKEQMFKMLNPEEQAEASQREFGVGAAGEAEPNIGSTPWWAEYSKEKYKGTNEYVMAHKYIENQERRVPTYKDILEEMESKMQVQAFAESFEEDDLAELGLTKEGVMEGVPDFTRPIPVADADAPKQLDAATAESILDEAGGDVKRAEEIARSRGYKF